MSLSTSVPMSATGCFANNGTAVGTVVSSEPGCLPGFYCPALTATGPERATICPPTDECLALRLLGGMCAEPMGLYEPIVCPKGSYCPTFNTIYPCPESHFCPIGTIEPLPCEPMASCPPGSKTQVYYGGLLLAFLLDLCILSIVASRAVLARVRARRVHNNNNDSAWMMSSNSTNGPLLELPKPNEGGGGGGAISSIPAVMAKKTTRNNDDIVVVRRSAVSAEDGDGGQHDTESATGSKSGDANHPGRGGANGAGAAGGGGGGGGDVSHLVAAYRRALGNQQLALHFRYEDLGLEIKARGITKTVLKDVSGEIVPGRMTAIMGPSGAGKTTFMSVLMGKVSRTTGSLFINGAEGEMKKFQKIIGFVPQDDIMLRELTVRENILHAARVRCPSAWTASEVETLADQILESLNLSHVANTIVGDEFKRGVSGGQRKRVNIGMELASTPLALFLDEPTSGLDSTAALSISRTLKQITNLGLTVVSVIHQPRYEIFADFDDILLLVPGGRTAYHGPTYGARPYFEALGYEFPERANEADVLMDILSGKSDHNNDTPLTPQQLARAWVQNPRVKTTASMTTLYTPGSDDSVRLTTLVAGRGAKFGYQLWYCLARAMRQQARTLGSVVLEVFVGLFCGALLGVALVGNDGQIYSSFLVDPYGAASSGDLSYTPALLGLLIGIIVALAAGPAGVKIFSEEKSVYWREAAAGHSPLAYYLGKTIASFPRLLLSALHFAAIFAFISTPLIDFSAVYAITLLVFWGVYGLATIVSMLVRRENASLLAVVCALFAAIFCGYGPTLANAKQWGVIFIWEMSFNKWAAEALYSRYMSTFSHVYFVQGSADLYGFTLNQEARDLWLMFLIGVIHRVIAFGCLIGLNRAKQR
ncbi:hypothetical protein HDU87_002825 [Geranomyces variabilis]|uniref:ABC transporter domain-containing protein n=1 Tax=Geranomyces variabilis TaxID=109894 RepID=A0AAD5TMI6_9FUNG|nr:hypothetical protein HDU87_002825 [Geranomyces variabilis]